MLIKLDKITLESNSKNNISLISSDAKFLNLFLSIAGLETLLHRGYILRMNRTKEVHNSSV